MGCVASLAENDQLVVRQRFGGKLTTAQGPGIVCTGMGIVVQSRVALILEKTELARIRCTDTGERRVVSGPWKEFLGPHEEVIERKCKVTVQAGEHVKVRNALTGDVSVVNGPAVVNEDVDDIVGEPTKTPVLAQREYCAVKDGKTGDLRVQYGPALVPLGPYESLLWQRQLPVLEEAEYCKIRDQETGVVRIIYGPCIAELAALDEVIAAPSKLPILKKDEYVKVVDKNKGGIRVEYGPAVVRLGVHDSVLEGVQKCIDLSADEYLIVRNEEDGTIRNIEGPLLFQPGAFDKFEKPQKVVNLRKHEYIKLRSSSGEVRVVQGEKRIVPDPMETPVDSGVCEAINVDSHTAVLVRNTDTGSLELVTDHGLFFPSAYQEIVEVQQKIVLEKYQTVVCKDAAGRFYYASGDTDLPSSERGPGPDFFLPPYHEIVTHSWSTDLQKEHKTSEEVWKFDSRPSYMNYEFSCRTLDNVTLVIDVTFFWRIIDVQAMVESTADAPGDVCTHARSMIMQEISRIKLMDFLASFNEVIRGSCLSDSFYGKRGVELLSVEVLKFECQSEETNYILQEMIKETCDRLKYKERQRGENEVAMAKLEGEIEEERRKQELVEVRKGHMKTEARIEGEAEGARIAAFLQKLAATETEGGKTLGFGAAMRIYEMNKGNEHHLRSTEALASGNAQLYLLPQDVNLNLGTLHNPTAVCPTRA